MTTLFEFSQAVSKLVKEKKYSDALAYFKANKIQFTNEQISSNEYLISAMLKALRYTDNFDNAFKFLEFYKITISENTKEIILNAYGWVLYSKFKAENLPENHHNETEFFEEDEIPDGGGNFHFNKSEIIERIEKLFPLILKFNGEYAYAVFSNLFTSVLKVEKKKSNANWKFMNDFCDLVTPEQLKTECTTIQVMRKGDKKPMELASDKENWFAYKSKALIKLGKFQECYDISKTALDTFETFHYSNDVWFARRIALSKKNLGNSEDAIKELQQVLRRKKEWFIQKELAELYKEIGDNDTAFKLAIDAINNFGDLEYKVALLCLIGELLNEKGQDDLAFKHFSLSRLIRINEEWNVPSKLSSTLGQFGKADIPIEKLKELKIELKKYWDSFKSQQPKIGQENNQRLTGKIDKILHNDEKGADGFIKYDGNKSVYFRVNSGDEIQSKISLDLTVEFKIIPATNDKKERAIHLKIR